MYLFFMERDNKQGTSKGRTNIITYPLVADRPASHPCFNLCSLGSSCASKPAFLGKSDKTMDFPDIPETLAAWS